jgi:hypothetical protein
MAAEASVPGSPWALSAGYACVAALMLAAAAIEAKFGIDAEMRALESIADPLSAGDSNS